MLKKEASAIVGGLSTPGKMPCYSINLPATECKTGAKLAQVPGTTCHGCYALKGRYRFSKTKRAMARRLGALLPRNWVQAMTTLITGHKYFRWHDSGRPSRPRASQEHIRSCKGDTRNQHWLPTREHASCFSRMDPDVVPKNLIIRVSATKVDGPAPSWWPWTSTVSTGGKTCPGPRSGRQVPEL